MAGQQTREGAYDVHRLNQSRNLALAGMTQPRLVNTGTSTQGTATSSGTGTVTQGQNPFGTILGTAAQMGPLSL